MCVIKHETIQELSFIKSLKLEKKLTEKIGDE